MWYTADIYVNAEIAVTASVSLTISQHVLKTSKISCLAFMGAVNQWQACCRAMPYVMLMAKPWVVCEEETKPALRLVNSQLKA